MIFAFYNLLQVIVDMKTLKQNFHEHIHEAQHYMLLSRDLHENLLETRRKVMKHGIDQRYRKMRDISETGAIARSILHKKLRQFCASATCPPSLIQQITVCILQQILLKIL
ncbi:unnamed protein product [Ilex paraguariensis]|uniref:Uncharacterized protein n=1 Tax=Ilex paraguariensis TaxID=185542 RepID=A0ABC8UNQ2_9AQUA